MAKTHNKTEEKPAEKVEIKAESPTIKHSKVAMQEMTALDFVGIVAGNDGIKFWAGRKFKDTEVKKAHEWCTIFTNEGAIDSMPDILK